MSGIDEVIMKPLLRLFSTALVFCLLMACLGLPATVSPPTSAPATDTAAAAGATAIAIDTEAAPATT